MTKQDQSEGSHRFAPRPVSRPPVDPSTTRAFGRPDGVERLVRRTDGKQRDQGEFTPTNQSPDPVLHEAFGRPNGNGDSLQRHPADIGALEAERDRQKPHEPDDPWRDPSAAAALGTPAVADARTRRPPPRTSASSACATCSSVAGCPTSRWRCWPSSRW